MAERFTLPVLPLRDTVVYPGVAVPISAGRPGTVEAVQEALDGDRRLFAVAQRENVDDPAPEYLYSVGTIVRIIQTHRVRGGVQLLVQGEGRAQALSYHGEGQAMLRAVVLEMCEANALRGPAAYVGLVGQPTQIVAGFLPKLDPADLSSGDEVEVHLADDDEAVAEVIRRIVTADLRIGAVSERKTDLEDLYLQLTHGELA